MWKTTRLFDFLENTKKGRPRIEYALTLDKVFSTWIRDRIAQYDFVENQDFVTFSENYEKGRPRLEYALTLDKTSLLGLRNVLSGTNLWKTKIISRFLKKGSGKINDL